MTEFAGRIGLDTSQHAFYDVFGLDEVNREQVICALSTPGLSSCLSWQQCA